MANSDRFWNDTVEALIAEPDPDKRESMLARHPWVTRVMLESLFDFKVKRALGKLST